MFQADRTPVERHQPDIGEALLFVPLLAFGMFVVVGWSLKRSSLEFSSRADQPPVQAIFGMGRIFQWT